MSPSELMKCPKCGSFDTFRVRRKAVDQVWAWFHQWPYQCRGCSRRFHSSRRHGSDPARDRSNKSGGPKPGNSGEPKPRQQAPVRGQVQVRTHPDEPMAGIVVRAESQSELNHILLTLSQALASYGNASQPQRQREQVWK